MTGVKYAVSFIATLLLLILFSCGSESDIQLTSHTMTIREFTGELNKAESMAVVTGTARNNSSSIIQDCVISITFYDKEKNVVGISNTSKQKMDPGESWNFTVQLKGSDAWKVLSYEIEANNK